MKKLSLILVALATMVMVGCKPLTGSTVCPHDWDLTDNVAPTCATNGVKTYTCTLCGDEKFETIPATGNHNWVDTDDTKVPSAKYYEVSEGVYKLEKVDVSPKYKCSKCGEINEKTIAFFTTDDHKTTIGKAIGVSYDNDDEVWLLPLNDTWTVEKYNSYYDEVVKNKGNKNWNHYCSCSCDTCLCQTYCTCGPNDSDDPDNCVRLYHNTIYFGNHDITVPNN